MKLVLLSIILFLSKPSRVTSEDEKFVANVYDDNFEEVIDAEMHAYIMILFYAPWCQHCKVGLLRGFVTYFITNFEGF